MIEQQRHAAMISQQLLQEIDKKEADFVRSTLEIVGPNKEQEEFLDLVCRTYLDSQPADKSILVSHLSNKAGIPNCLLGNAYRCAKMLKQSNDVEWLRCGLASSYLAARRMDERDVLLAWAELYVVAEEAGIPPDQEFLNICGMDDFGRYAVVRSRRSGTHKVVE
jgi:hypothetical protein